MIIYIYGLKKKKVNTMSKVQWTNEQALAISLENQNIMVSAGAGSGKTAVLTTRIVQKLKKGIHAQQLLVLTFTNAAAAEMKNRVLQKMKEDPDLKNRVHEIEQAYITTFDSFALSIVKKYHYLLNLTQDIHIVDSSMIDMQAMQFLNIIFENLYEKQDESFLKMMNHFTVKDDKEILNCILNIHKKLDQKADKQQYLQNYMQTYASKESFYQYQKEFLGFLKDIIGQIKLSLDSIYPALSEKDEDKLNAYFQLFASKEYDDIYANLATISTIRMQTDDEHLKEQKRRMDQQIKKLKELCFYPSNHELILALEDAKDYEKVIVQILLQLDSLLMAYKKQYQAFEFVDIAKMALSLVQNFPFVRETLKKQFVEILIDEYQDTNDLQELFIQQIAQNNIYVVGDVKQSIYRFRNANPDIFIQKYADYQNHIGGTKIDLTSNFRSSESVIQLINTIFNHLMTGLIGGAKYSQGHAMKYGFLRYNECQKDHPIEYITYTNEQKQYKDEDIELFYVVQDILNKIKEKMPVYDADLKEFRPCTYQDFAILLEKSKSSEKIQKLLQYYQIPAVIYKNENLLEGDLFHALYNIFVALQKIKVNQLDTTFLKAYYGLGRSFLWNQSDDTLYFEIKNQTYFHSDLYLKLKQLTEDATFLSNKEMVLKIIDTFSIYERLILIGDIEANSHRLQQMLSIAQNLTDLNIPIFEMGSYFENLMQENKKIEIPSAAPLKNQVKIMTIHKSKGLEFPICYFILNFSKQNEEEKTNKITYSEKYGIIAPFYQNGVGDTIKKVLAKQDYDLQALSEKIRLFYVALTRCRENMIIINKKTTNHAKNLIECKTFKDLIDYIASDFEYQKEMDLNTLDIHYRYLNAKEVEKVNKEQTSSMNHHHIDIQNLPLEEKEKASKVVQHLLSKQEKEKMDLGTKIHEIFELTDFKQEKATVHPLVQKFLNQDLLKNIQQAKIYKELPFIFLQEQKSYSGVIDLILEYADHVDIIDYKLKNIDDEAYQQQLKIYANYVFYLLKKPVFTYLYSILDGQLTKIAD